MGGAVRPRLGVALGPRGSSPHSLALKRGNGPDAGLASRGGSRFWGAVRGLLRPGAAYAVATVARWSLARRACRARRRRATWRLWRLPWRAFPERRAYPSRRR